MSTTEAERKDRHLNLYSEFKCFFNSRGLRDWSMCGKGSSTHGDLVYPFEYKNTRLDASNVMNMIPEYGTTLTKLAVVPLYNPIRPLFLMVCRNASTIPLNSTSTTCFMATALCCACNFFRIVSKGKENVCGEKINI